MRYRGPYEYDKFTLNTLNYVNFVNDYIEDMSSYSYLQDTTHGDKDITLHEMEEQVNEAYDQCIKNMETVYKKFILNK
jgi:hypothetical protein